MKQDTVTGLHIVRFEPGDQSPDQLAELGGREGARGVFGIDEQWLVGSVECRTAEGEGQEVGIYVGS